MSRKMAARGSSGVHTLRTTEWPGLSSLFPLFLVTYLLTHVFILYTGSYIGDEGYYLYGGSLAIKGRIPYRDFAFWQPPFILYVYGIAGRVLGHSLVVGRWVSLWFGLTAFALMWRVVWARGGYHARCMFGILLTLNLSYAFDTTSVKTQSLAILLYALAISLASSARGRAVGPRRLATRRLPCPVRSR